jgi:hypothetical protein
MLPVTTRPPGPPGAWGSPYGAPQIIDLSEKPPWPWPQLRWGPEPAGFFMPPKGCWIIQCGPGNSVVLFYRIPHDDDDGWAPQWGTLPPIPPPPGPPGNEPPPWQSETLVDSGKTGTVFADGQNLVIEGFGTATIIQVFSS